VYLKLNKNLNKKLKGPVVGLQISSDDSLLVTGSGDFAVMVWDIEKEIIIVINIFFENFQYFFLIFRLVYKGFLNLKN